MVTPVKYTGIVKPFFEIAITGAQQSWYPGQARDRSDADAALLIASGNFALANTNAVDSNADPVDGNSGAGTVQGAGAGAVYDPATLSSAVNVPVTFPLVVDQTITQTIPIPRVSASTGATWHYNINRNAAGNLLSISAWGVGSTGLVGGY